MLRIKVTHGTGPATYHFYSGWTPPKETPSGWGQLIASGVPIVTMAEQEYEDVFKPVADLMFLADAEDINAAGMEVFVTESWEQFCARVTDVIDTLGLEEET